MGFPVTLHNQTIARRMSFSSHSHDVTSLGSRQIEHDFRPTVGLQERRGYQIGNVTFDRTFHDVGLIFTPSDTNDTTSRHQIGYTQRNGAAGNILARIELRRCHVASIATEQHQTAGRVELRTRFVKCQISDRTDLAQS